MHGLPPVSVVDAAAAVIVLLGLLNGVRRGLSGELAGLVGSVAAFLFGLTTYRRVAVWLADHTRLAGAAAGATAFLVVICGALLTMFVIRYLLRRILRVVVEKNMDRIGGGIAGLVTTGVVTAVAFIVFNLWPNSYLNRKFGEESLLGALLIRSMPALREDLPPRALEELRSRENGILPHKEP
jgi:uncharacterized membrane protein required for colicin V production